MTASEACSKALATRHVGPSRLGSPRPRGAYMCVGSIDGRQIRDRKSMGRSGSPTSLANTGAPSPRRSPLQVLPDQPHGNTPDQVWACRGARRGTGWRPPRTRSAGCRSARERLAGLVPLGLRIQHRCRPVTCSGAAPSSGGAQATIVVPYSSLANMTAVTRAAPSGVSAVGPTSSTCQMWSSGDAVGPSVIRRA